MTRHAPPTLPESRPIGDTDLITLVYHTPGICLRDISARLWDGLPWASATPSGDSATTKPREICDGKTAALWLHGRLLTLCDLGYLRPGPPMPSEVDTLAGLTYFPVFPAQECPCITCKRLRARLGNTNNSDAAQAAPKGEPS